MHLRDILDQTTDSTGADRSIENDPAALHPVTREIISKGAALTATEVFEALYRLEGLRKSAADIFTLVDGLALPTAPTVYTCEQIRADPIKLNSRLGTYTNFANLLGLCGIAVPGALHADGTPFGITFLAPAGADALVASIARQFHADSGVLPGAVCGAKVGGANETGPLALRVTSLFRLESGAWKLVHRHADPITSARPAASVINKQ